MVVLTRKELVFLKRHKVPRESVKDLRNLSVVDRRAVMRTEGSIVCLAGGPCRAKGHRLRVSGGQCAECNPHAIAFTRRHRERGWVYVAWSKSTRTAKVGTTGDPDQRVGSLRGMGYGGIRDWELVFKVPAERAGDVEFQVHRHLRRFAVTGSYNHMGKSVSGKEMFKTTKGRVLEAVKTATGWTGEKS